MQGKKWAHVKDDYGRLKEKKMPKKRPFQSRETQNNLDEWELNYTQGKPH